MGVVIDSSVVVAALATTDVSFPVRVASADRSLLKRMARGGSVSAWLPPFPLARHDERDRDATGRFEG